MKLTEYLTELADTIRETTGKTGLIPAQDFSNEITEEYQTCLTLANSIDTGMDTSDATAKAEDIVEGKIAYSCGERLVGTLEKHNTTISGLCAGSTSGWHSQIYRMITKFDGQDLGQISGYYPYAFYGCASLEKIKNIDLSKVSNFEYGFYGCSKLTEFDIDLSAATNIQYMCVGCNSLIRPKIKTSTSLNQALGILKDCKALIEAPWFETAGASSMSYFFENDAALVTFPEYNTQNVSGAGLANFIKNCPNLSDESLDNMLKMCLKSKVMQNAASAYRTLASVGFTAEQLDRCLEMDSYKACLAAGWTRGV